MRRTEQEFKAELLKRTQAYRQQRAKKRKTLIGIGMCACICYAALIVVAPMGGASNDTAAADMITAGGSRTESAMSQSQESGWEYCQEAPAVMDNGSDAAEPEEESMRDVTSGAAEDPGVSRVYSVVSIEVKTYPEDETQHRFFTDAEKVASIENAIERFYPADAVQEDEQTGLVYEIVITYRNKTQSFSLIGDGLYSETEGWISVDADASRRLKEAISQESDMEPDVSVSKVNAANSWPLSPADAQKIIGCLTGDWIPSAARCDCDYILYVNGETYCYHSDCGTFQDENAHSLTASEDARLIINAILEAYGDQEMNQ